jgi:hypothetical protein
MRRSHRLDCWPLLDGFRLPQPDCEDITHRLAGPEHYHSKRRIRHDRNADRLEWRFKMCEMDMPRVVLQVLCTESKPLASLRRAGRISNHPIPLRRSNAAGMANTQTGGHDF